MKHNYTLNPKPLGKAASSAYSLHSSRGFTLIEAVIAIAIVGVVGIIVSQILSRSFKGSNKSQLLGVIKQNGQGSLSSISQIIRSSENVVCPTSSTPASVITLVKDGKYTRIYFKDQTSTSNGYIAQDTPVPTSPPDAINLCNMTTYPEVGPSKVLLTDTNDTTGVSVNNLAGIPSGTFQIGSSAGYKSVVTVQFDLMPAVKAANSYDNQLGESGSLNFKTTIQQR